MRHSLTQFLVCPECRADLDLNVFREDGEEVEAGVLRCSSCHRLYPIIGAIPRMLPDALIGMVQQYHPEFFETYKVSIPAAPRDGAVARTLTFFTRQRPELYQTQRSPAFAEYLRRNLELRIPEVERFAGQFGLDAGCGDGRYSQCMAEYGAEVVAMDLGNSVDYARRRTSGNGRVHVVQGSILQPPFRQNVFEFITSVGVLHHLPDPRQGFQSLVPLLAHDGTIHIWVYGLENMSAVYRLSHLTFLRGLTTRLSPTGSYIASVPIALALELGVFLPVRVAVNVGLTQSRVSPQLADVAALPFSAKVAEVHDRIGAPVTHFVTCAQLQEWFADAGLQAVEVTKTPGGRGWTARGAAVDVGAPIVQ